MQSKSSQYVKFTNMISLLLIRLVVSYGADTWTLTKKEKEALQFLNGKYLEEYMVLNMKMGNGKVGRIEN